MRSIVCGDCLLKTLHKKPRRMDIFAVDHGIYKEREQIYLWIAEEILSRRLLC